MADVFAQAKAILLQHHSPFSLLSHQDLELRVLTGSTNLTCLASAKQGQSFCIIKRLAPTDGSLLNRERQLQVVKQCSRLQISPSHYYQDKQWRIQQYLADSLVATPSSILRPQALLPLIRKLISFHAINLPLQQPAIEQALNATFAIGRLRAQAQNMAPKDVQFIDQIVAEFEEQGRMKWQKYLEKGQKKVCLCHNDLNLLNILIKDGEIFFIDMEYSAFNYLEYDLANFIFESTIDYQCPSPPYFSQSRPLTDQWVRDVTRLYAELAHLDFESLLKGVRECLLLCNLFWAAWSVLFRNPMVRLDYNQYGLFRIRQFKRLLKQSEWINR